MLTTWSAVPMLDRVFDDVMRSAFGHATTNASHFTPAVEVREKPNEYLFHIDVPGVKREDIEATFEDRVLAVKGTRRHEAGENEQVALGRAYGNFALSYTLPDTVDGEPLSAELADGVLTIRVPKHPKAQPRKITIGGGSPNKQLNQ
jgi:HSP20 family protein